jgi:hypothetical protein
LCECLNSRIVHSEFWCKDNTFSLSYSTSVDLHQLAEDITPSAVIQPSKKSILIAILCKLIKPFRRSSTSISRRTSTRSSSPATRSRGIGRSRWLLTISSQGVSLVHQSASHHQPLGISPSTNRATARPSPLPDFSHAGFHCWTRRECCASGDRREFVDGGHVPRPARVMQPGTRTRSNIDELQV